MKQLAQKGKLVELRATGQSYSKIAEELGIANKPRLPGPEEFTRQYWFDISVTSDWKIGSPITYMKEGKALVQGKVLVADRPKLLSYTFHETFGESSSEPPTKVTLEIEPELGTETVRLTVTHTDFVTNSKHRPSISQGWPAVISGLKSLLETGKTLKFES